MHNDSNIVSKPARKSRNRYCLLLSFVIVFVLAGCIGITSLLLYISRSSPPSANIVVQEYYQALKNKNYVNASSFFDPQGTINVNNADTPISSSKLHDLDTNAGEIQKYQVSDPTPVHNTTNVMIVAVKVTRQGDPYKVNLILILENEGWKIIHTDNI